MLMGMTCDEPRTTTHGDAEAAHARFSAISRAYRKLVDQANALVEAVGAEYEQATEQLSKVQDAPGIDLPATGEPYTYDQTRELERLAAARLRDMFPWARLDDPKLPQYHDHGPGRWCGAYCAPEAPAGAWARLEAPACAVTYHGGERCQAEGCKG